MKQYKNGFNVTEGVVKNLRDLKYRVEVQKKASLLIIDGLQGEGKTTLGVICGDVYSGEEIDLSVQYAMGGDEFLKKLKECFEKKKKVLIYDEAGDFSSRSSLTKFNRNLSRVFETFRRFQIFIILILPCVKTIDRKLFDDGVPRMLLHCHGRGLKEGKVWGYDGVKAQRIVARMKKVEVPQAVYKDPRISQNFNAFFTNISDKRAQELDDLSLAGKMDILDALLDKGDGFLTFEQIANNCGKSVPWARIIIKNLHIKPEKIIKKRKYFNKEVLNVIMGEVRINT